MLKWITAHSSTRREPWEIAQWSALQEQRGPADLGSREFFNGLLAKLGKERDDIVSWFDLLDLDDYVSFGGKA
jgi:hypothetical protein